MCGITGTVVFKNGDFRVTPDYITRMRDQMIHRGPDDAGLWIAQNGRVGLGHRRLSIIDLSDMAAQPMSNEDGSVQLVYNGEIYNHLQIRQELIKLGHREWKTDHSDTEMIVHAYEEWGIDCINRFRGVFAFGIWDNKEQVLWLVRDRMGVKPLYYSIHNGRIVFASEIKALLQDPNQERAIDENSLYHYLSFLTTPAPNTLFNGVKKLSAGTLLRVTGDGEMSEKRWWDLWDHTNPLTNVSEDEICHGILSRLRESVQLRKIGDVPTGVFLSGGIDSSVNAALFAENSDQAVKTFTIGYQGQYRSYQNENHYAKIMADKIGGEYHEKLLTIKDLIDFLPEMVRLQDEPIADPVCVPLYYVCKLARETGMIYCQVGEGSDELFWGYESWRTALNLQKMAKFRLPGLINSMGLNALRLARKDMGVRFEWLRRWTCGQPIFWGGAEAFSENQKKRLLSPRLKEKFAEYTSWEAINPIRERFEKNAWETSHLNWMSYIDLNLRLPELLLMRVDKMGLGVSLEGRVPFLDHELVQYAMSIPETMKTKNGQLKHILKKSVRGLIPDVLIDRKKQGFGVPVYEWFFEELGEESHRQLKQFCNATDILDWQEVQKLMASGSGPQVWYLLNLALWWKEYIG